MTEALTLTDGIVTLRTHRASDLPGIHAQATDPDAQRWTTVPHEYTTSDAAEFVERNVRAWSDPEGVRSWAIEYVAESGEPVYGGTLDVRPGASRHVASLGFALHPAARGRGLMTRAVRLAAAYGFENGFWGMPLQRITWAAIAGNWGSRRVAWACGFGFDGTLPASHLDPFDRTGPALDTWHASLGAGEAMEPKHPWLEMPVLENDVVRLRPWRDEDVEAMEPAPDDPKHWIPPGAGLDPETFPRWLFNARMRAAVGGGYNWCIADRATDHALGSAVLFGAELSSGSAELGYQLVPSARGRGAAKHAAGLVTEFATRAKDSGGLGLRRLSAVTVDDNEASNAVLRSAGFIEWGREPAVSVLEDGTEVNLIHWHRQTPTA